MRLNTALSHDLEGKSQVELMRSFAARLGKIGHVMRRQSAQRRTQQVPDLVDQMSLIEVAELRGDV
jgi:Mor family transcriptional regulator